MSARYVCVHGHFYQPPRENAWLETVEMQESAYPDHNWNERITRECYGPNAKSRLLDASGRIARLTSNYSRMSFNFGPTLLAWMKDQSARTYADILASDRASAARFGGHGSAMAQGYNHTILPLCNDRDRRTQVRWGIRDFAHRYGRQPEGMWLPETAVDTASLEVLAEHGIAFTVLAPRQAAAWRTGPDAEWQDANEGIDPTRAYRCHLPSGRDIALFFYDGPISQAVAFEGLLNDGSRFADRLLSGFNDDRAHPQLVHIATDGESYGHHHRHGDMALAAALERIDHADGVELINYGLFLERHPPEHEARIHENSSWSCVHGIERWRSDCGCNSGRQGFHQRWRAPLREAFDWLRDAVAQPFEQRGGVLLKDPWAARDAYIDVILDRSPESVATFLQTHGARPLSESERTQVMMLMELQRHAMLMYTSCAWFFDDVAGIETTQVIQYAARVVQLASRALDVNLEAEFLERLEHAHGSMQGLETGRVVYESSVRPAMLDLKRVGAHYALSAMFAPHGDSVYSFDVKPDDDVRRTSGRAKLLLGNARFRSRVLLDEQRLSYGVLHLGDHTVSCGVREYRSSEAFHEAAQTALAAFDRADFAEVLRILDREFGGAGYSIGSLFRDKQHEVVRRILEPTLLQVDASYRQIYEQHAPLARFLKAINLKVPRRIGMVGTFVLSQSIRDLLDRPTPDLLRARELVNEASQEDIALDEPTTAHAAHQALSRAATACAAEPQNADRLRSTLDVTRFVASLPFAVDPWPVQEAFFDHLMPLRGAQQVLAARDDEPAKAWTSAFTALGEALGVVV